MKMRRKLNESKLILKFRKLGLRLNLGLSNCQLLGNVLMGLYFKRRKLVIADGKGNVECGHTIELADLSAESVKKVYKSIRAGELSFKKLADFINSIHVLLEFRNGRESIEIPIYGNQNAENENIHKMERKVARWYNMVSRMTIDYSKLLKLKS